MNLYRSHNCGELNISDIDKDVYISGWVIKRETMEVLCLLI